jgi:hypothetical protein
MLLQVRQLLIAQIKQALLIRVYKGLQFWHTLADTQSWQLAIGQETHEVLALLLLLLVLRVKLVAQVEQTLFRIQLAQLEMAQERALQVLLVKL